VSAQGAERSAIQQRLADSRPLGPAEIGQVLAGVRRAAGGTAFRFTAERGGFGAEILFETDGHVRFIRSQVNSTMSFTDYTGRAARYCDGTFASGELVIEYRQAGAGWTVKTRESSPADLLRPVFDMLVGLKPLRDDGLTSDGARALSAGWNPKTTMTREKVTGGRGAANAGSSTFALADPSVSGVETLVIDPMSLLPARWTFTFTASSSQRSGTRTLPYRFEYDSLLTLEPPRTGVAPPACVEPPGPGFPPGGFLR